MRVMLLNMLLDIISVFAFGLSLYNFIHQLVFERKKVSIKMLGCSQVFGAGIKWYAIQFCFVNRSKLPISIYDIEIKLKNESVKADRIKHLLCKKSMKTGDRVDSIQEYYTLEFPISLQPLMSCDCFAAFDFLEKQTEIMESQEYVFVFYTSRGMIQAALTVPNFYPLRQLL